VVDVALVIDKGVVIMLAEARKVGVAGYNIGEGSGEAAALYSESARKVPNPNKDV
jgi:hypothetical protein